VGRRRQGFKITAPPSLEPALKWRCRNLGRAWKVTGSAEFKKQFALAAAKRGMKVEFTELRM